MLLFLCAVTRGDTWKNHLKTDYESSALPMSYSGNPEKTGHFWLCARVCRRTRPRVVFLHRNGLYYAQTKIRNPTGQLPLHGETLSDAVAARQVLKMGIKSDKFLTRQYNHR